VPDARPENHSCLRGSIAELPLAIRALRPSAEPAVVLSSLARCCVRSFSDGCAVELSEGTDPAFRVRYPLPGESADDDDGALSADGIVTTPFDLRSCHGRPAFAGVIVHSWRRRRPTSSDALVARLLVDGAISLVRQQRLAELAAAADERSAQLAIEAITSATIGQATGIVMATCHLTSADALDLLSRTARETGRDLYRVAVTVVSAGGLELPTPVPRLRRLPGPGASTPGPR
jgi:ANTAR domain